MSDNCAATDWKGARGEKWRANLEGMEQMLSPVDEPLIQALRLDAPYRIADAGCGGGGTARKILHRAPPGSVVHGFDVSQILIDVARSRKEPAEQRIAFEVADLETADPPHGPYDRLVSRFGIMFFSDPAAAFANLLRWVAPGGRFALAAWGPAAENTWVASVREVAARYIPVPAPDPDAPGPFRYADASKLTALLERAGFRDLDARQWRGMLPVGGARTSGEAASFALTSFSSFGELLAEAGDEVLRDAQQALTAELARYEKDGRVWMNACVELFTGAR